LRVVKLCCTKLPALKGNPGTCKIVTFAYSKRKVEIKEEKKILERKISKTAPYIFCKYQCQTGRFLT
jgi:hypothetical protein